MINNRDIDITKNIKIIETFKAELLSSVSNLYKSLLDNNFTSKERSEILSNIIIITYLLSDKLGISYNTLDTKVLGQIKLGMLDESNSKEWKTALLLLSRHIDKNRDLN